MYEMDQGTINRIYDLRKNGHPNAVPVFGGAAFAYNVMNCDEPDVCKFIDYVINAIKNSHFWGYTNDTEVAEIFCHLCLVDPYLIGVYFLPKID